ncbi:TetR-like C-terminal domain-containing protein [Neobacillus sp. NPDC093182]|uniref:TetR/AcrR family transcriptional regulator n=1 Tax=Neobacillus sp. NPDC093182 TaxID=3364297 RepID=UPI0037FF4E47
MSIKNQFMDRRIVKSKKAMKSALITLMREKELKEISVSDIVRLADINRGTFYKHYQYVEDILNEMTDEVITELTDSYREPYKNKEVFELNQLTTSAIKVFDHILKYADFYSLMVQSKTLAGFQHRFCSVIKDLTLNDLKDSLPKPQINRELHVSYQAYAMLGLVLEWINGGFKYSSSYMAEQLLELIKQKQSNTTFKTSIS